MRKGNLDQVGILQNIPPKIHLNESTSPRNRLLRESSPFPFKINQNIKDDFNSISSKNSSIQPLISKKKRIIIRPDGTRTNARKLNIDLKNKAKRLQAPFATDTPPINSARRYINKNPKVNNHNQIKNLSENNNAKHIIHFQSDDTNSPRRIIKQNVNNEIVSSSFPNKNIAIIKQTEFQNSDLPLFPPSRIRTKYFQFPKRVKQVESIVIEHKNILNKLKDLIESTIQQEVKNSSEMINDLVEKPLNTLLSEKVQIHLNQLFEKNSIFEKLIENSEQIIQNECQETSDFLNEQKVLISQFANSIQSFESSNALKDSQSEVTRFNDKIDMEILEKLQEIENDEVLKSATTLHLKDNLNFLNTSLTDKFNSIQARTDFSISSEFQKLQEQIQFESTDANKKIYDQLSLEIEILSNSTKSTFSECEEAVEETSKSMKLSVEEFEKSCIEATDSLTSENSKAMNELSEKLNASIENSHKSFEIFRDETISTIRVINEKSVKDSDDLLKKIEEEFHSIQQNSIDVQKKFENFTSFIENEKNMQLLHFFCPDKLAQADEKTDSQSVFTMDAAQLIRNQVAPDLALISYSIDCINSAEGRIQELESSLENTKSHFCSQFEAINKNLNESFEKVNDLNRILNGDDTSKSLSEIENNIEIMENLPKNQFDYAQKAELKALEHITQVALDEKIAEIRNKLEGISGQIEIIKEGGEMKLNSVIDDNSDNNNVGYLGNLDNEEEDYDDSEESAF